MIISQEEYDIAKRRTIHEAITWKDLKTGKTHTWLVEEILTNVKEGIIEVDRRVAERRKV